MVINQRVITNNSLMRGAGRGGRKGPAAKVLTNKQMLSRLATDPKDAEALISVYEQYEKKIREAAVSWFGNKHGFCGQAVNNILVAIGRQAGSYDPHSMDASEWVSRVADAEARRLRQALDACGSKGRRPGRAV
jgi:hypothetical protein